VAEQGTTPPEAPSASDPCAWLENALLKGPDRTFIETSQGRRFTYRALEKLSAELLSVLARSGVSAGDRVLVRVDKSVEAIALYVACLRLGAVFVPLNTAYTTHELEYFIRDAEPALIVVRPEDFSATATLLPESERARIQTLGTAADGSLLAALGAAATAPARMGKLATPGAAAAPAPTGKLAPEQLAALLYTSGTTGKPKAAMLTRGNLASNAASLVGLWRFTSSDVLLHSLPIFHIHGLFVATNTVLAAAASMIFLPKFDTDEVLRVLPRASVMMGVPTYYTRMLGDRRLSAETTRHMRLFVSGSAPLSAEHHREFRERTGHEILERYGMTETSMIASNRYERRVPGAVGAPLPGVEVRITQDGSVVREPDKPGMIEVRGPNVFQGYWRNPQKTAAEFRQDGFFVTGDIGRIDAQGYVHIVGRAKDLIITGGYNVYPAEVEQELNALAGVYESAVFGVPHPDFGEGVTALIVRSSGSGELDESTVLRSLRERLAGYKLPKRVLFAAELPRNTMGKVQKQALRDLHAKLYVS
jgi:malonyl-CoA/methylmalonyl-CoA synthetase